MRNQERLTSSAQRKPHQHAGANRVSCKPCREVSVPSSPKCTKPCKRLNPCILSARYRRHAIEKIKNLAKVFRLRRLFAKTISAALEDRRQRWPTRPGVHTPSALRRRFGVTRRQRL